jgi:bacteriocin biosynthesis cyclodehydratase domain-containing protein
MIAKPQLKAYFHAEVLDSEQVFLLAEDKYSVLEGRAYALLTPFLDGRHTIADLAGLLNGKLSYPELLYTLKYLEARGYITEGNTSVSPAQAAFWHQLGLDTATALDRLRSTTVTVRMLGNGTSDALHDALAQMGIQQGEAGSLLVVIADDYTHPALAAINAEALSSGRPWMLVRLVGKSIWVGPLFQPGQTGCWSCLAERIQANRQVQSYVIKKTAQQGPLPVVLGALPTTIAMGAQLAALEIVKWILQGTNPQITGQIMTLDVSSLAMQSHALVRRPQCPICGDPARYQVPKPVQLNQIRKHYTGDGGHRSLLPEETFARYQHHISPITGVVNWLINDSSDKKNGLVYSYMAGHNFAMVRDDPAWLRRNLRSYTGGKGMTDIQAKVGAIGEAIERYSGVYRGDEPVVRGSHQTLGAQALHPHDCLCFSAAQYANRQAWNARADIAYFHKVPQPFDVSQELDWSPLWSLTNATFRYLPTSYCYFGYAEDSQATACIADSNGCAAGNTLEEAILQGFLELVERDCVSLWWYNRVRRPAVDIDSFNIPYLSAVRDYYHQIDRELWVIDLTTDLGIPTFAAISRRTDRPTEDIIVGFGAHLDPTIGLLRAVTELNQFLPTVSNRSADGSTNYAFHVGYAVHWWKTATLASESYLSPDPQIRPRRAADYRNLASDDFRADVQTCIAAADAAGLEMLVQDQTRPDIGMAVCRVVVPGLRHFWRRLGSGRLYTVPVKLGWLSAPTAEDQLNPFSLFF